MAEVPTRINDGDGNHSKGPLLLSVVWTMSAVAVIVAALRLYTSLRIVRRVKLEEYLMLAALICGLLQAAFLTVSAEWGLGKHIYMLSEEQKINATKFYFLCEGWSIASTAFGRISFSVYLLQFLILMPIRRVLVHFSIISQAVVNAVTIILVYVQCGTHPAAKWDPRIGAKCWSPIVQRDLGFVQCAWNSLTDLFLTVLPATIVWNLPISWRKKLGVSVLLGASAVALAISIIKAYAIKVLGQGGDVTWNIVMFLIWSLTEAYIIIIAASIPPLAPLIRSSRRTPPYQRTYEAETLDGTHGSGPSSHNHKGPVKPPDVV